MAVLSISINKAQIEDLQRLLGNGKRGNWAKAAQAAISRTITFGRAQIARQIGGELNLRIGDIKKVISVSRGSYDKPEGSITVTRKRVFLAQFLTASQRGSIARRLAAGKRGRSHPLTIKVRKQGDGKYPATQALSAGSFLALMPDGYVGIFKRHGRKRFPIRSLPGPSALGVFLNARGEKGAGKMVDEVVEDMQQVLTRNLRSQVDRFLAGENPGAGE